MKFSEALEEYMNIRKEIDDDSGEWTSLYNRIRRSDRKQELLEYMDSIVEKIDKAEISEGQTS